MLGKKKKSIVGLDIGSTALKAIELRPARNGFELVHIAHQNLQSDTIVDGHIIDLNHVSDSINRIWTDQSIKTNQVATSLSGHAVIVKKILLPMMSSEELDEQIHWEAEQYIPFDINDVNLYHEVIGNDPSGQNMDVLLVACKRDKIAQFTQVISQAGKQPVIVDVDAFALQNAYEINYHPSPGQTVALLDIGASVMTINIVRHPVRSVRRVRERSQFRAKARQPDVRAGRSPQARCYARRPDITRARSTGDAICFGNARARNPAHARLLPRDRRGLARHRSNADSGGHV